MVHDVTSELPGRHAPAGPTPGRGGAIHAYECYGVRFALQVPAAWHDREWRACLPPGSRGVEPSDADPVFALPSPASPEARSCRRHGGTSVPVVRLQAEIESRLRFHVAVSATEWTFVHAGVVAWRQKAIVIPGPSGAGKSTLVAALVRAGATYYSDEIAVLGRDGLVRPFAKPIALVTQGLDVKRRVPASEIGGTPGADPVPIGLVASLTHVVDGAWSVQPMTRAGIALTLLSHAARTRIDPRITLAAVAAAARSACGIAGVRGDAEAAAPFILNWESTLGHEGEEP